MTIVAIITAVLFAGAGLAKVVGLPMSLQMRDELKVPAGRWKMIGTLEILGAIAVAGTLLGIAPPVLGGAAAVGFILLMIGAILTRVRAKSAAVFLLMDVATLVLAVLTANAMLQ